MSIGEGIMVGVSVLAAVGFAAWCLWLVSSRLARHQVQDSDVGAMLFAAWAAAWVLDDEGRVVSVVAWLEQRPRLTSSFSEPVSVDVLSGGLELYCQSLPRLTGSSL